IARTISSASGSFKTGKRTEASSFDVPVSSVSDVSPNQLWMNVVDVFLFWTRSNAIVRTFLTNIPSRNVMDRLSTSYVCSHHDRKIFPTVNSAAITNTIFAQKIHPSVTS